MTLIFENIGLIYIIKRIHMANKTNKFCLRGGRGAAGNLYYTRWIHPNTKTHNHKKRGLGTASQIKVLYPRHMERHSTD